MRRDVRSKVEGLHLNPHLNLGDPEMNQVTTHRLLRHAALVAAVLVGGGAVSAAHAESARYEIDDTHTVVAFLVEHIGFSRVLGRFDGVEGAFNYDPETRTLEQLEIVVDTTTVNSGNEARDKHVRKADFLDVKKHPTMTFAADSVTFDSDAGGSVPGTLTLLGQSQPLTLEVVINKGAVYPFGHKRFTFGASAEGSLSRSAYGMDYGVANGLVGDEVELLIELEAVAAK